MKDDSKTPLVSVCIPVYNSERYIQDTLLSAINLNYDNLEILVVDNHSNDRTMEKVAEIAGRYPGKMTLYTNEKNLGMVGNWNRCIELANGEYINILHADDFYHPNIIDKQIAYFKKHPNLSVVFTLANFINEKGRYIRRNYLPKELEEKQFVFFEDLIRILMKYSNLFTCPSAMIKTNSIKGKFLFQEGWDLVMDIDMWFRLAKEAPIAILNTPLIYYRLSEAQATSNYHKKRMLLHEFYKIMEPEIKYCESKNLLLLQDSAWGSAKEIFYKNRIEDLIRCYQNAILSDSVTQNELLSEIEKTLSTISATFSKTLRKAQRLLFWKNKRCIMFLYKGKILIYNFLLRIYFSIRKVKRFFGKKIDVNKL